MVGLDACGEWVKQRRVVPGNHDITARTEASIGDARIKSGKQRRQGEAESMLSLAQSCKRYHRRQRSLGPSSKRDAAHEIMEVLHGCIFAAATK
ncbi:MAG TPA: hypothetical protein DGT23_32100 [Micromonosporaceae bacterium]|nr:hypothetical protein [Micromonosporaceae bacterium]